MTPRKSQQEQDGALALKERRRAAGKAAKAQAKADAKAAAREAREKRRAWEKSGGAPVRIDHAPTPEEEMADPRSRRKQIAARRQERVALMRSRPGARGWPGRGGGKAAWIEPAPEYRGTSVQVCGLWPFSAGSGTPVVGVPLGQHLETGSTVCGDPVSWFMANLINQPSGFVLGRPGLGKSTLIRRMITVLAAWGIMPLILSDLKPDYVKLVLQMGGQHIRVGRGLATINPLDQGPIAEIMGRLEGELARQVREDVRGRQLNVLVGLLELVRNAPLDPHEMNLLSRALQMLDEQGLTDAQGAPRPPLVSDVEGLIRSRPDQLAALAQDRGSEERYLDRTEALIDSLSALGPNGPFGEVFCSPTSVRVANDRPVVFDMSSVDETDQVMQAALQLLCWSFGQAVAQTAEVRARAGLGQRRIYIMVMDELWRILRASPLMIDRIDALTRLNRQRGLGQLMITHTMNDLRMGSDELTAKAWGFVERSALVFLGGLATKEMGNLSQVFAMSEAEARMITGWADEGGINADSLVGATPPGQGKFLLKLGKRPGIPFKVVLTSIERDVNDTNLAFKDLQAARRANRHNGFEYEQGK